MIEQKSMNILIINGPNLNLLGQREPEIYGEETLKSIENSCRKLYTDLSQKWFQSNLEGEIIDIIQTVNSSFDALIINPGGYSHTSVAIYDALLSVNKPIVEVHLSNIYKREDFRHKMITAKAANAIIAGCKKEGYYLALNYLINLAKDKK